MDEVKVTKENFKEEVLDSKIPVLVDFWAEWCGPCRALAPILSEIAEEYSGSVKVCKVNVDDEKDLARQFKIMSIPMVYAFDGGNIIGSSLGYRQKDEILSILNL